MSQVCTAQRTMLTASDLGMAEENGELLLMAAMYDQVDFMNDLLNAEVHGSVHSRDNYGLTPLHHAACHGSYKCVELLLQKEADPDACSHIEDNCNTPLHHAARIRNLQCIKLLVEYGANIELRNVEGLTAMDILQANGAAQDCISYLESVIEKRKIEQEEAKREELYDVIAAGSLNRTKELLLSLDNKEDAINRYYRGPNTLLYKASIEGYPEIVRLLLENGANGRPNGGAGLTPLYAACFVGNLEVARILVEVLPHLLMQPTLSDQSVPLHAAISRGNIAVVRYLLSLRKDLADIEPIARSRKNTASKKNSRGQDELPKTQAKDTSVLDVNVVNNESMSPLHLAVCCNNKDAVLELLNCKPILKGQVDYQNPSCLVIDIAGKTGETPLQFAIRKKNVEIARMLLLNGADPNRNNPDADVNNPLQEACLSNCRDMVKLLLDHGANPNLFNQGKPETSPLSIASKNDVLSIVKLLLEFGATDTEDTALLQAVKNNSDHIVEVFLEAGVFTETESELQEKETNYTAVRLIWTKRQLPEVKEKWIVDAVVRQNVIICLQKSIKIDGILNTRVVSRLITKLDLSGNNLTSVPLLLFQLPSLRKLTLADNKITALPLPGSSNQAESENLRDSQRRKDASDAAEHPQKKEEVSEKKNGAPHQNGGVRIRPASESFDARNSNIEAEQYQKSGRPASDFWPKNWQHAFNERKQEETVGTERNDSEGKDLGSKESGRKESGTKESERKESGRKESGQNPAGSFEKLAWDCPLLEELDLQKNQLTAIPKCLFELQSLRVLNLLRNEIEELPLELWSAPSLKDVLLQQNNLKCLPSHPHVTRKQNRTSRPNSRVENDETDSRRHASANVSKSDTVRSKRPSWDGESSDESDEEEDSRVKSGLYKLDISDNKNLTDLPIHLPCLAPNLCKLTAAGCSIKGQICISQLPPELTMLDLSRNEIKKFDLTGNGSIADRSCFSPTFTKLRKSSSVPTSMNMPKQLKRFCHHRSHQRFNRLKNINLSDNNLEAFLFMKQNSNSELFDCALPELQTLALANNELKEVPVHIGKIRKLLSLDIIGNTNIDTLPPELGLCSQLYELKFNPLQIRDPNRAIVEKKNQKGQIDVPYIRNFLRGVCEKSKPYPTIKLMLVGHSRKGKSTLLENLRREGSGAYQDPDYHPRFTDRMKDEPGSPRRSNQDESTVGVDVCDWTYQKRQFIGSTAGPEIKFSTWDFAGQEEYYATHTCFLSRRAIYLLVWKLTDGIKGINQLEGWLLNIQTRAPDSSVIIVGTHYDEVLPAHRKQVIDRYREVICNRFVSDKLGGGLQNVVEHGLPRVIAVTEVSSKARSEYNIKELRGLIYEKVLSLRDSGDGFLLETQVPASYLELEKVVLAKAKSLRQSKKYPVLDAKQFRMEMQKEIKSNGFRELNDDELENAVKFLHDCGVLLHFDGPSLDDLYFIDPQWLCDMLANVITIRDVNPFIKNGVLKVEDLRTQIFKGRRFSSSHVKKYIDLMNKFEVALQISSHYLLVPSLLPEKQSVSSRLSSNLSIELRDCMNNKAYFKEMVFRRLYRMAYVPSGFWARLITRLIADSRIGKAVTSCSELVNVANETPERIKCLKESLGRAAPPEWACWKTGVELSCFGVKLLRVCQLSPGKLHYGHSGNKADKIYLSDSTTISPTGNTRFIEILVPNVRLEIEVDSNDVADDKTGFRVVSVDQEQPQKACELLALTAEHFDNLIVDWFPALDSQNIHGQNPVRKIGLCPQCLVKNNQNLDDVAETNRMSGDASARAAETGPASQANGNGSQKKFTRKQNSKSLQERKKKGSSKSSKRERAVSADNVKEQKGDIASEAGEESAKSDRGSSPRAENSTEAAAEEQNDEQDTSQEHSSNAEEDLNMEGIKGFEFEEAMKLIDANKNIECEKHGVIDYSRIFPDLVFNDLAEGFVYQPNEIEIGKFIAAGSYGAVFRATLKRNAERTEVAVKVPNNTDAGTTQNLKAKQDAEKNKKLKEGALTIFVTGIYTAIRQELAILVPVSHPHIVDLIGVGLSPLRLVVDFAPKGSLDSILCNYKNAGRKLDSYILQKSIVQVSSALEYLHEQSMIYRDLKSENVLVWSFPEPGHPPGTPVNLKLTDYGVSRAAAIGGVKGLSGTSGFIAPEILRYRGKESYSKKIDSFSFGSFIYELITQEMPFQKYGSGQADQFMAERKRPKLVSGDKRIPIPILSLLYKCWEHDPLDRPSSAEIHAYAKLREFPRLFDDLECDDQFRLKCALTAFKERPNAVANCADTKSVIGSELWLFSNSGTQMGGSAKHGEITVMNYVDGKCNVLKVVHLPDRVLVACVVGSTIWIGMESGAIKVFCLMTYKPLGLGRSFGSGSIISIIHSPVCHCVMIGLTNDCIMSYNENISAFIHTIPHDEVVKHFGNIEYKIKELIANKVHPGNSMYNPIHCMAAVPSRTRSEPMEDVVTYYGPKGEPLASSSRDHRSSFDEYMRENSRANSVITYELWCGVDKGLINIFDLKEVEKVYVVAAPGCDVTNPTMRNLSVKCIETRRTFQSGATSSAVPKQDDDEPTSVWVAVYPGTFVYRWNVDERRLEARVDALACVTDHELNSLKQTPTKFEARDAQINVILVVENELYIGTSSGHLMICESMSLTPILSLRCFSEQIDYLIPLQMTLNNRGSSGRQKEKLVLCSGRGCLDKWNKGKRKRPADKKNCTILTWFADQWAT